MSELKENIFLDRCFVAVDIDEEVRNRLSEVQNNFSDLGLKMIKPENMHITLRFLGDVDSEIAKEDMRFFDGFPEFEISVVGLGNFPRILWAGVKDGANELEELSQIAKKISVGNVYTESSKFSAHITIARDINGAIKTAAEDIEEMKNMDFGRFSVKEIKLRKSSLSAEGPLYSDIYSVRTMSAKS